MRRRTQVFVIGVLVLATATVVAACSSSSPKSKKPGATVTITITIPTTTSTTLPPAELKPALKAFFASELGKEILEFERVTHPFAATGKQLHKLDCRRYVTRLNRLRRPNVLSAFAQTAPDPNLGNIMAQDLAAKRLYLSGCVIDATDPQLVALVKKNDALAVAALAKSGYPVA